MNSRQLPVESSLPTLAAALSSGRNAVLVAEPGAGKTTRVPLALLHEPWLAGRKIIMLEPRRLAARGAAKYMAYALGEQVGETVGYRVRMDTKVGPATRIEVVTEGVLTRMLQTDPALEQAGLVIFDEFHERSLQADLGLALCLQSQALLREDLHLLVMSATLEAEPVAALLGDAPVIRSEGRMFPVETVYRPRTRGQHLDHAVVKAVKEAMRSHEGDLLVFLPGMAEIRTVESKLKAQLPPSTSVCPLHGSLPFEAQDRALAPAPAGHRKVVLSTSVAETSLTVEGISVVIDSGLMRVSRFSPRTGMSRLETVPVSAASADQRRGRAGRLKPGTCYRLWSQEEQQRLSPRSSPEMIEADLAPLVLELAVWGVSDPLELNWLDAPPAAGIQQARELLVRLGALADNGAAITSHGRQMAGQGLHPRLSHMMLRAIPLGLGGLACDLAVLLRERDFVRSAQGSGAPNPDLRFRLQALYGGGMPDVDEGARRRIREEAGRLRRELGVKAGEQANIEQCGLLLAFAYPDRIARQRDSGKYLLSGGRGATFAEGQALAREEWLVAADLDDSGSDSRIRLAAPISMEALTANFADEMTAKPDIYWDAEAQAVRGRLRRRLGAILLEEAPLASPPAEQVRAALLEGIRKEGLDILPWSRSSRQLQERIIFLRHHDSSWPDVTDDALIDSLGVWLTPYIDGYKSRSDLQRLNMKDILESLLTWEQRRELDGSAPTHWTVPSGSRLPIDYSDPDAPFLAVRLQELFGLPSTPCIAGGKVPLTLHLLSPAQRPVQVTRDLASFWRNTYFEVRKDLKGRYPKHYWPDDPLQAPATRRAKPPGAKS